MLKRTLAAPPESGAIVGYSSELSRLLRNNSVPGERADQIISEAEAHLHDHADAIAKAENLSGPEAEARAVASFTPAASFARQMMQSVYETTPSRVWGRAGATVAVAAFCELLRRVVMNDLMAQSTWYFLAFAAIFLAVSAFQARRAQTRNLVVLGVAASVFAFVFCQICLWNGAPKWTENSRGSIEWANRQYQQEITRQTADIHLLQTGLQTFGEPHPVADAVPAELLGAGGKGFLVPDVHPKRGGVRPFGRTPETVATLGEARKRWLLNGYSWLSDVKRLQFLYQRDKKSMVDFNQKTSFSGTAIFAPIDIIFYAPFVVLWDMAFAALGRAVFVKRRAGRKPKQA